MELDSASFVANDVFWIKGKGIVITGSLFSGILTRGMQTVINSKPARVSGIETFRNSLETLSPGQDAGVLLSGNLTKDDLNEYIKGKIPIVFTSNSSLRNFSDNQVKKNLVGFSEQVTDIARQNKPVFSSKQKFVRFLILFPGLWLIFYLFILGFSSTSKSALQIDKHNYLLEEFIKYRNFFYLLYALALLFFGTLTVFSKIKKFKVNQDVDLIKMIIPSLISGIILVTFSYAIAEFLLEIILFLR